MKRGRGDFASDWGGCQVVRRAQTRNRIVPWVAYCESEYLGGRGHPYNNIIAIALCVPTYIVSKHRTARVGLSNSDFQGRVLHNHRHLGSELFIMIGIGP